MENDALPSLDPAERPALAMPTQAGPDEDSNILGLFTAEQQAKIAQSVVDDFDADVKSRAPRMKKLKEFTELYSGQLKTKSWPWQRCANVNLNVLSYTSLQVHARLYDMVWPDNGKVIYSAPSTVEDFERASVTEKFSNSYVRNKMPEMAQGLDDTLAQVVVYGSGFRRTYWDSYEGRARSDWIPIEDFVVAHEFRSQDPSMRDVPRYTFVMHPTLWELQMHGDRGIYANVDQIKATDGDQSGSDMRDAVRKIDGVEPSNEGKDEDKPRMLLEQHRIWQMPNSPNVHPAFDGKPHYVTITVDKESTKPVRFVIREEDDPDDRARFLREKQAFVDYTLRMAAHSSQMMLREQMAASGAEDLPQIITPAPAPEPAPIRKRQVAFFTHYRAFYSEGFYGLGFGDFIGPMNRAANTILNQHIDGVTVRNSRPGFISRQMRMQRGQVNIAPGELVEVDAPASSIRDGIVFLDPPLNDPTTMGLVNLLIQLADKFSGSSDIMSGATSGANRTAKEMQILNAQLMKQISVLAKRVREAQKHEFDKLWRLWGTFLPEEPEPTDIIDPLTGAPERIGISRKMFVPDARVFPAADPRMRFEKVEEAMQKFQIVAQNPMLMQNPAILRAVTEDVLKAHDAERLVALLPPPVPPGPPPPKPHWAEASGWLKGEDSPVNPADDDGEHIQMHLAFLQSPDAQTLERNARQMAERHINAHKAQAIEKRGQRMMQQGPPQGPPMIPGGGPPRPPMMLPPQGAPNGP